MILSDKRKKKKKRNEQSRKREHIHSVTGPSGVNRNWTQAQRQRQHLTIFYWLGLDFGNVARTKAMKRRAWCGMSWVTQN